MGRTLLSAVLLLLLAGCSSTSTAPLPAAIAPAPSSSAEVVAPKTQLPPNKPSIPDDDIAAKIAAGFPKASGTDQADDDGAAKMAPVKITDSKLVGYGVEGNVTPSEYWPEKMWLRRPMQPGQFKLWIEPGYWDYEIVKIEGKEAGKLNMNEWMHFFETLPEPMHLQIRSRSGQVQEVEAFTHPEPQLPGLRPASAR